MEEVCRNIEQIAGYVKREFNLGGQRHISHQLMLRFSRIAISRCINQGHDTDENAEKVIKRLIKAGELAEVSNGGAKIIAYRFIRAKKK